jgi:AcrR family transcriptional regulator
MPHPHVMRRTSAPAAIKSGVRGGGARVGRQSAARSERTRSQLLEAAGKMFADHGFDGATGQAICRKARVNPAAIVYHFGGMVGLHRAVLDEALRRLVTTASLANAVKAERGPRRQLAAFLGLIVHTVTSPASQAWPGKLFGREFISPSAALGRAHDRDLAVRSKLLKSIVSALTGMPANDPRVARSCISIMAPCALLLLVNRRKLRRLVPELDLSAAAAPQLTQHLVNFALAGLAALRAGRAHRSAVDDAAN